MALLDETKAKLRSVVVELVNDCLNWYVDDLDEIQKMNREQLKWTIAEYMAMRCDYRLIDKPMPRRGKACSM